MNVDEGNCDIDIEINPSIREIIKDYNLNENNYLIFVNKLDIGKIVRIYNHYEEEVVRLSVRYGENKYTNKLFWISSLKYKGKGISENLNSKYYIDNKFYSNRIDQRLEDIIANINYYIMEEKVFPKLLDIIENYSNTFKKSLFFLSKEEEEFESNFTFW